jgi:hypothetical protein
MIEDFDPHDVTRLAETPGERQVFLGRRGVAGGMVVKENETGRLKRDRLAKDLAGMDETAIEAPARDDLKPLQSIARVQYEETELLDRLRSEPGQKIPSHVLGRAKDGARLRGLAEQTPSQLERGHQTRRACRLQSLEPG